MTGGRIALIASIAVFAASPAAAKADTAVCTWKVRVEFDHGISMTPASGRFYTSTPGGFTCVGNAARHSFSPRPGTIMIDGAYDRSTCLGAAGRGTFRIVVPRLNLSQVPQHTTITGDFELSGPPLTGFHNGRARPHEGQGIDLFAGAQLLGSADPGQDCFVTPIRAATISGVTTIYGPIGRRAAARKTASRSRRNHAA